MKRLFGSAISVVALLWAIPAGAQVTSNFDGRRLTLGAVIGAGAVQKVATLAGGTLGIKWTDKLEIVGEGIWSDNTATRRKLDLASSVGSYLQISQGTNASGTIKAPTVYAGGGVRLPFLGPRSWRPYFTITAGAARITLQPEFSVGGGSIGSRFSEYGVTLGRDLTGSVTKPAISGSLGFRATRGRCYLDTGVRYIYIQTAGQGTSVPGAAATLGFAF